MKKYGLLLSVLVVLLALAACETLDSVVEGANTVGGIGSKVSGGGSGGGVVAGTVDFRSGEMLASPDDKGTVFDCAFGVGKVMTPASAATKNQAEVLFVDGGFHATRGGAVPPCVCDDPPS